MIRQREVWAIGREGIWGRGRFSSEEKKFNREKISCCYLLEIVYVKEIFIQKMEGDKNSFSGGLVLFEVFFPSLHIVA